MWIRRLLDFNQHQLQYSTEYEEERKNTLKEKKMKHLKCRQQFYPAVTWDTNIDQPSVPSYSRVKFLAPLQFLKYERTVATAILPGCNFGH